MFFSQEHKNAMLISFRERSLVIGDLRSEIKGSWFESGCYLCALLLSILIYLKLSIKDIY